MDAGGRGGHGDRMLRMFCGNCHSGGSILAAKPARRRRPMSKRARNGETTCRTVAVTPWMRPACAAFSILWVISMSRRVWRDDHSDLIPALMATTSARSASSRARLRPPNGSRYIRCGAIALASLGGMREDATKVFGGRLRQALPLRNSLSKANSHATQWNQRGSKNRGIACFL
jgi:hypothetical protein